MTQRGGKGTTTGGTSPHRRVGPIRKGGNADDNKAVSKSLGFETSSLLTSEKAKLALFDRDRFQALL